VSADELCGLRHLTGLTRLSAAAMVPELDDKAAALLATLTSLQHLVSTGFARIASPATALVPSQQRAKRRQGGNSVL